MDWVKIIHLLAVFGWMASVFAVPRALIYWRRDWELRGEQGPIGDLTFRLYRFSAGLAVIGVALGLWLATWWGWPSWTHWKTLFVAVLAGHYAWTGLMVRDARRGRFPRSDRWLRVFNEASVVVFLAILWAVVAKP
ncbi:CopD family protein [Jannaschia sp. W003]|uniref:CopD family protein n=1 Tax=Jannaschia sp. W003 TaxID=2867012 RepID=UPI0021A5EA34|nr:CopD family protein [Jannaschia sp. W003]UWQ22582.1 CopD family protein [Jannaschia sp. W003]